MNKKAKIVCLLTLVAGWALMPVFAWDSDVLNIMINEKVDALSFHARLDDEAGPVREAYATELVDFCLNTIKDVLTSSIDSPLGVEVDFDFSIPHLLKPVIEFYKVSSFYTPENTPRISTFHDLYLAITVDMHDYRAEFESIIKPEEEALEASCTERICFDNGYCYNNHTSDFYGKLNAFKDARYIELIEERFRARMKEMAELLDEILEVNDASEEFCLPCLIESYERMTQV